MRYIVPAVKQLLYAVLVLIGGLCAAEIALRAQRVERGLAASEIHDRSSLEFYVMPSTETFQQLRPLTKIPITPAGGGSDFVLETNSFGLRGPEVAVPKPRGVFRVICLGDETTVAAHLPPDQTYCARLQERLQAQTQLTIEVINAGIPHGCPLTEYLLLKQRLIGLQPDVVMLHIDPTDVRDDRAIRPFTWIGDDGLPLAAVHPATMKSGGTSLFRLADEFAVVDWLRQNGVDFWEQETSGVAGSPNEEGAGEGASTFDSASIDRALSAVKYAWAVAGGAYCELIVTSAREPFRMPNWSLAEYSREHGIPYADAAALLGGARGQNGDPTGDRLTASEHDVYASVQAEAIVAHVPGIWTKPSPASIPALPDIARNPAE